MRCIEFVLSIIFIGMNVNAIMPPVCIFEGDGMRLKKKLYCLSLLLVATLATAQNQDQKQENSNSANPLAGLNGFLKGVTDSINSTAAQAQTGAQGNGQQPAASRSSSQGNKVAGTKLARIFANYPAAGDEAPEWPKIAISISEIPRAQLENHFMIHRPAPSECMRFSIKLWSNAKTAENFNNLELCGSDIAPGVSFSKLMVWKNFPVTGKTAGQVRTGPTPPYNKVPSSPQLDKWFVNDTGYYYLGSLLYSLGYDWNYAPDSRRVWVAKVEG